jgi:hypothetical protein
MLGLRRQAVKRIVTAVAAGLAILGWRPAAADPVADFYAHKSIRVLIGYSTGGGYDLYARELAKYMGKYIPGTPTLLPENMPGAGSLRAANYLYAAAPKDGTVIGTFSRGLLMEGLLNHSQGVMYDATKFTWLGSVTDEVSVCAFSNASGVQTWQDMLDKSYTIGGTASGADTDIYPTLIKNLFGLKLKLVTGFPGGADVDLALRRHEVDGRCGWSLSSLISRDKPLLDNHEIAGVAGCATGHRPDRRSEEGGGVEVDCLAAVDGTAVRCAAGAAGRPRRGAAISVRSDREGSGLSRRDAEARARGTARQRRGADEAGAGCRIDFAGCAGDGGGRPEGKKVSWSPDQAPTDESFCCFLHRAGGASATRQSSAFLSTPCQTAG